MALLSGLGACRPAASADEQQLQQLDTALLALNKFQASASEQRLNRMAEIFDRNGASDSVVFRQAQALRARTTAELAYLRGLHQRPSLLSEAAADTLRQRLRDYSQYVRQFVPETGEVLGLDVKDDLDIQAVVGHRLNDQSFGDYNFKGNSQAGSSAMLGLHTQQVLRLERDALTKLAQRMGPEGLYFDKIAPFAVAEAKVVRAAEPYRAKLFLAAASPDVNNLRLTANGVTVPMAPATGSGQISFLVPADAQPGIAIWQGTIQGVYHGRPVTFSLRVPYQIKAR
ncbi:hypothetical protein GCM10027348_42680 [Hymenobacter tenuis]